MEKTLQFENLVNYEEYKTISSYGGFRRRFENLVNYEEYKTAKTDLSNYMAFENLVNYEEYKTFPSMSDRLLFV